MPASGDNPRLGELLIRNWQPLNLPELAACVESAEHVLAHVREVIAPESGAASSRELETLFRRASRRMPA